ncbi:MAG: carbohydrate ABC transporter permease [Candidatus Promineofilum sp.]|jgi:alpha-glucoside transport system permease protein|nr:carbohydrate ABC transporter permease [Promineifilum sp.]
MGSLQRQRRFGSLVVNGALLLIVLFWTVPTIGLFVSSFRSREAIQSSGWWNILPHRAFEIVGEPLDPDELGLDATGPMAIGGGETTFEEMREGYRAPDGRYYVWIGNRRNGRIEVQEQNWTVDWDFSLANYQQVLAGKDFEYTRADGTVEVIPGDDFVSAFLNSLAVAVPATVIPILVAAFAAYGFAWMRFPGRRLLFIIVVALLVVPLQLALVPILGDFRGLEINGTFLAMWLAHTGFGLPLATYLLFNYISGLPRETLESAFIDGASHFTVFRRLILPLSVPALASFAIFQFLWVWNDYLVALIFLGGNPESKVITQRLADIVGSRGNDWHLLTAGAFITMLLPLIVFFSLQRFFVRGLLAGSVKG